MSPYQAQSISPGPQYLRQTSFQQTPTATHRAVPPQTPTQPLPLAYAASQQLHPTPALTAAHPTNYTPAIPPAQVYTRPPVQPVQAYNPYGAAIVPPNREQQVFVLPDAANESIPKSIRDQFPQDSEGRVLFFTKPPVVADEAIYDTQAGTKPKLLAHSEKYLAAKAERDKLIAAKKRAIEEQNGRNDPKRVKNGLVNGSSQPNEIHSNSTQASHVQGSSSSSQGIKQKKPTTDTVATGLVNTMQKWIESMNTQTIIEYKSRYGDHWKEYFEEDQLRRQERAKKDAEKQKAREEMLSKCHNPPTYDTSFSRDIWGKGFKGERY